MCVCMVGGWYAGWSFEDRRKGRDDVTHKHICHTPTTARTELPDADYHDPAGEDEVVEGLAHPVLVCDDVKGGVCYDVICC